jgi:hypothetical protein
MTELEDSINEGFATIYIGIVILIILVIVIIYIIYLTRLVNSECNAMNNLYPKVDGSIRSINSSDTNCRGKLFDYYIKTAYNACSGGSYKNDFVDVCNLKAVLKQGVRCLDFEIYSINNNPVVATSTTGSYYIKETFNSLNFSNVMDTIKNYAFANGTCPNPNDPIILHLRFMSNNQQMYSNLANIFKSYDSCSIYSFLSY